MSLFTINGYNLDDTQVAAIKSKEKSTLVVAGAGSGKTLTILGKIRYLIENEHIKETEILCISFTNETVKSLKNKTIEMGYNLDIYTFHKLGLSILGNVDIISDDYLDYIIDEYFESRIKYDKTKFIKSLFFSDKSFITFCINFTLLASPPTLAYCLPICLENFSPIETTISESG